MTQENKELLLKDLCARVPYRVKCHYNCVTRMDTMVIRKANCVEPLIGIMPTFDGHIGFMVGCDKINALEGDIKPYLRPLSSMTDEEITEYWKSEGIELDYADKRYPLKGDRHITLQTQDWLTAHHFDFRGLIEKGLALEAPADMYKTE